MARPRKAGRAYRSDLCRLRPWRQHIQTVQRHGPPMRWSMSLPHIPPASSIPDGRSCYSRSAPRAAPRPFVRICAAAPPTGPISRLAPPPPPRAELLRRAGARALLPAALGDNAKDLARDFDRWRRRLWPGTTGPAHRGGDGWGGGQSRARARISGWPAQSASGQRSGPDSDI